MCDEGYVMTTQNEKNINLGVGGVCHLIIPRHTEICVL